MKELLEKFESEFDEADGWVRIVGADWFADDLKLDLSIKFQEDLPAELWEISCTEVFEESLCTEGSEIISLTSESPLLIPFIEPQIDIMFSENNVAPAFLLGVVCSSCHELLGRPEYVSKFLNLRPTTSGIVNSRYGLLGRFPESVANRIIEALKEQPIKISALPGGMPKHWNGSAHIDYPNLKVLEIGKCYVIGGQFSAERA